MASEQNRDVVHRYTEAINQGNLDAFDAIISDDLIDHAAPPDWPAGRAGLKQFFVMFRSAFPDLQARIEDLLAEGDKVAFRYTFSGTHQGDFMGIPATGKHVTGTGIDIARIEDGQIAELWGQQDMLGLLQQLGAIG